LATGVGFPSLGPELGQFEAVRVPMIASAHISNGPQDGYSGEIMANHDLEKEREEGGEDTELKVKDRRLFTAEGELRGETVEETPVEEEPPVSSEPETAEGQAPGAEAGFERRPVEEPENVDFTMLINAMAQPALIFLGEIAHPATGKPEINLEQARLQIDLLDLLRVKCRGNLTNDEEGLLDSLLYQLRMLCVARSQNPQQPPAE
jgi:hypothetical protein